jgi:hypothetical protein
MWSSVAWRRLDRFHVLSATGRRKCCNRFSARSSTQTRKVTLPPLYVGRMTDRSWQNFERTIIPA